MGTKINQDYYGQEANWSTVSGSSGYIKHSPHNIERLMTNDIYQGGDFDMTAAPWGIGKSSASSNMEFVAAHDAKWHIHKLDRQKGNTPLFLYINSTTYLGALSNADYVGGDANSDKYELALFRSRVSPDAEYNSGLKSTLTLDSGTGIECANSTQNLPILLLDYRYVRMYIEHVYYKPVGSNTIEKCTMDDIEANRVDVDSIAYFDCHLCYNRANGTTPVHTNVHCSIGGNAIDIDHVFKDVYYWNATEQKYARPCRYIERFGYWYIDTNWYSADSFRYTVGSNINNQTSWTTLGNTSFVYPNPVGTGWAHASTIEQSFSDGIKYKWNYGLAPYDANQWTLNEIEDGDSYTSDSDTFRSFAYMELTEIPEGMTKNEAYFKAVLHEVAFLGFPIALNHIAVTHNFGSADVYLPVFDDHMITTGEFKNGNDSLALINAQWTDIFSDGMPEYDPEYDPDPEDYPVPEPSDNPMLPVGLNWTLAGRGTGIWALTPSEIDEVWDDIFGSDIKLDKFGANPMNAILSLKWTPFTWDSTSSSPIILGTEVVNPLHTYKELATITSAEKHGYGTLQFKFDKNFYNARYMQARLFLPFYGYYELPTAQLLSSRLRLDFYYDVPDDLGVWVISYDDVIYDFVECCTDIEVPLTGSNAAAIAANARAEALTIAQQVASLAVTGVAAGSGLALSGAVGELGAIYSGAGSISGTIQSLPWLEGSSLASLAAGGAAVSAGISAGGRGLVGLSNTLIQGRVDRAALRTNLPYHGTALQTTFLHMSMKPYIQIFKNSIMEGLTTEDGGTVKVKLGGATEGEYKLKVGHACNIWATPTDMPDNSLLQTTGIANMSTAGMEMAEVQELNQILQTGFFK